MVVEKLLTAADVAQRLGLSEAEVAQLAERGELRALRLGGELLRFHPDDVAAWQATHHRRAASPPSLVPAGSPGRQRSAARPSSAVVGPEPWWERWGDFLYAYDFYLVAALLIGAIIALIVTMQG